MSADPPEKGPETVETGPRPQTHVRAGHRPQTHVGAGLKPQTLVGAGPRVFFVFSWFSVSFGVFGRLFGVVLGGFRSFFGRFFVFSVVF